MKEFEAIVFKAVLMCNKPFLKPDEAMLYCNLKRSQFLKKCKAFGVAKNEGGYYVREELNMMLSGESVPVSSLVMNLVAGSGK